MRLNNIPSAINLAVVWSACLLLLAVPPSNLQSVRLAGSVVNATGINEGRIEVFHEGQWKDVCHRKWDHRDAEVVCRQIGFSGAAFAMVESHFGNGVNNASLQNFDCSGDEATIEECRFKSGVKTCRDHETAGVSCFYPGYLGCVLDRTVGSILGDDSMSSDDMTVGKCLQYCYDKKMRYAGLRKNTDCHCGLNGTEYDSWGSLSNTNCMLHCGGNQAEACGGSTTWFYTTSVYDVDRARCPEPVEPSSGYVKETGAFWFGSTATFDCYPGYQLEEAHSMSCVLTEGANKVVWQGKPSTCTEIPDPTRRNKEDEWDRIVAQANILKGKQEAVTLKELSSTRVIIGSFVGFFICVTVVVTILIIWRRERTARNRSPKIKKREEANGHVTGYHLANGASSSACDAKI